MLVLDSPSFDSRPLDPAALLPQDNWRAWGGRLPAAGGCVEEVFVVGAAVVTMEACLTCRSLGTA